ncbi:GAP family protein [Haladaptatus caseinilyticus]|uniref:GAP family protein n=1 Tax=Haladaptatus caseinilyticus TaxID=2993314 RepID=UPI00224B7C0D|nr:GAP family protein [Haladaptatus caseinilyticus]
MSFLQILPLAVVMVAGPQILSAIFLATSRNWRRNSAAFVSGAALSITLIVTAAYLLGNGAKQQGTSNETVQVIVLVLLLVAMVHTYLTREESEPPKWMGTLEKASPRFSFKLGFLLLGFFPTDILTSSAVGSYLAGNELPWTDSIPFIALSLSFLALPSLALLAFGERAETFLPKARDWMNTNSWVVNEIVILFFIAMTLNNLLG